MRGCSRCEEFERLMEEAAREHWDVIHRYRQALDSEQQRPAAEDLLRVDARSDRLRERGAEVTVRPLELLTVDGLARTSGRAPHTDDLNDSRSQGDF